jgi:hypothetical protein
MIKPGDIWKKTEGTKRTGALVAFVALRGLKMAFPDLIGENEYLFALDVIAVAGAVGLFDWIRRLFTKNKEK